VAECGGIQAGEGMIHREMIPDANFGCESFVEREFTLDVPRAMKDA
jgi:hypothetical protein